MSDTPDSHDGAVLVEQWHVTLTSGELLTDDQAHHVTTLAHTALAAGVAAVQAVLDLQEGRRLVLSVEP